MAAGGYSTHNRVFAEFAEPRQPLSSVVKGFARDMVNVSWRDIGVFTWVGKYTRALFVSDFIAALVVAIMLIPQGMAYAALAGLDPIYGLYSSTIPVIVYSLCTTSSQVAVGPVAPTAILMEGIIRGVTTAPARSPAFTHLHFVLAFLSGAVQLVLAFCRFGIVASLLSWPVMSGFSSGAAFIIIVSQLPDLMGVKVPREDGFFMRVYRVGQAVPRAKWQTVLLGIVSLIILLFAKDAKWRGRKILPARTPVPLVVLVLSIIISAAADLQNTAGIAIVGEVPSSLPVPSMPVESWEDVRLLWSSAVVLGILNYVQTVTLGVVFGKKVGQSVSPNKELFALGSASFLGSFFSCHTVAGSFTRTAVQAEAGARTPFTSTLTGVLMLIFIVTLTRVCKFIPTALLAAIVLSATRSLISIADVKILWRAKKADLLQLVVTFVAVLAFDIQNGLLIGVGFSLANVLFRSFKPRLVEIGRLPQTDVFVALGRFPGARRVPGVSIWRLDGELHFGNVSTITDKLTSLLYDAQADYDRRQQRQQQLAASHVATAPGVDASGIEMSPTADPGAAAAAADGPFPPAASGGLPQRPLSTSSAVSGVPRSRISRPSSRGPGTPADVRGSPASTGTAVSGSPGTAGSGSITGEDGIERRVSSLDLSTSAVSHASPLHAAAAAGSTAGGSVPATTFNISSGGGSVPPSPALGGLGGPAGGDASPRSLRMPSSARSMIGKDGALPRPTPAREQELLQLSDADAVALVMQQREVVAAASIAAGIPAGGVPAALIAVSAGASAPPLHPATLRIRAAQEGDGPVQAATTAVDASGVAGAPSGGRVPTRQVYALALVPHDAISRNGHGAGQRRRGVALPAGAGAAPATGTPGIVSPSPSTSLLSPSSASPGAATGGDATGSMQRERSSGSLTDVSGAITRSLSERNRSKPAVGDVVASVGAPVAGDGAEGPPAGHRAPGTWQALYSSDDGSAAGFSGAAGGSATAQVAGRDSPAERDAPLRAVIVDAARIVRADATAIRELVAVMDLYCAAKCVPKPVLLWAGIPGPVRDGIDQFFAAAKAEGMSSACNRLSGITQFLTVAAAVASLYEQEQEDEEWWEITQNLGKYADDLAAQGEQSASDDVSATGGGTAGDVGTSTAVNVGAAGAYSRTRGGAAAAGGAAGGGGVATGGAGGS